MISVLYSGCCFLVFHYHYMLLNVDKLLKLGVFKIAINHSSAL